MEYRLQGRTFIDIGKALGVTPGRAHQLVDVWRRPFRNLRRTCVRWRSPDWKP